jgi:5-methylcytosine-specific restriction protein A
MPNRPLSACSYPGCAGRATDRGRCGQHARTREQLRGTAASRGYGAKWRRQRATYFAEQPYCVVCLADGQYKLATDLDHVVPREQGGSDEWDNLQGLCKEHHSAKTMRQSVRG